LAASTRRSRAPLALVLLGGLGLVASVTSVTRTARIARQARRVPGEILDVGVEERQVWRPLGRRETRYRAYAFYRYEFEGREYEGETLSAFRFPVLRSEAYQRSLVSAYAVGQERGVHVLADDPRRSFLSVSVDWWLVLPWMLGSAGIAVLGLAVHRHSRLSSDRRAPIRAGRWLPATGLVLGLPIALLGFRLYRLGDPPWILALGLLLIAALGLLPRLLRRRPGPRPVRSVPGP